MAENNNIHNPQPLNQNDAITFIIQCYFGDISDPILASINRAYLDMQTHTISRDPDNPDILFQRRKTITEYLHDEISRIPNGMEFDDWHRTISQGIKERYAELSFGQIQKWLNMTIKYLFTLKELGVDGISEYISVDHTDDFHPALDSFVLQAINRTSPSWSNIQEYNYYNETRQLLSFAQEYLEWPQYAFNASHRMNGEERLAAVGTYKRYVQDHGNYAFNNQ